MFGLFAKKGPFTAKLSPSGDALTVQAGDNLLKSALDAGLPWPHNCRVGSCGQCRSRLISGKIKELNDFSYVLSADELDKGMILACQTCLRSDVEVEVALETGAEMHAAQTVTGRIDTYRELTHDILEIGVKLDMPLSGYLAGQYAEFSVPSTPNGVRCYSFASAPDPDRPDWINFFVRLVPGGLMTGWLHDEVRLDTPVEINGPFGNFWLRDTDAPMLCVAGGSGLAPIKALLEQVAKEGFKRQVIFIFGARTQKDLYCLDEMAAFNEQSNGAFHFLPVLSEEPDDSDWTGLRGMNTQFIASALKKLADCEAYLCGPPGMVDSAVSELNKHGLDDSRIYFDKFLDASHSPNAQQATG